MKRRVEAVHKALRCLDRFLASYHDDGGCDEGPGYWSRAAGSLYDCFDILAKATHNGFHEFDKPLIQEMGRYIVRVHIYDDYFVNFADASARLTPDGALVYSYGKAIGDEPMQLLGAWAFERNPEGLISSDLTRALRAVFLWEELERAPKRQPLLADAWLSGIQVMTARYRAGSPQGLFVAAKGGHNAESHNHNDVGNFIVYADGKPASIDVGVGTYTRKTFSAERYSIWTMQSAWHNLPTINGIMQSPGEQYRAQNVNFHKTDTSVELTLDLAGAYPREAGVVRWLRSIKLDRKTNQVVVQDTYTLSSPPKELFQSLISAWPVRKRAAGKLELVGSGGGTTGPLIVEFPAGELAPIIEEKPVEDSRLERVWGPSVYRIRLVARKLAARGSWQLVFTQRQ